MADTAILRPTSDAPGAGFTYGMGAWTRSGGAVAGAAFSGCDESSLDETDSGYATSRTGFTTYNPGRFEFYLSAPPTGVTISSLSLKAYMRRSMAGADYMVENPRVKGFVMVGVTRYYQSGPSYVTVAEACNRNTQSDPGTNGIYTLGTWATNPATAAAWTLSDLAAGTFIAGVEAGGTVEGLAANGIPHSFGGSSAQFDLAQFWVELTTTPSETFVNPIRISASAFLRLLGRPLRMVEFSAPASFSGIVPGDSIYLTHPFYPTEDGAGAGEKDWQRRPVKVLSVSDSIEPHEVRIRALDMVDRACTFWSTWRTDVGADTTNLSGIPRFDQGGGYTVSRTSSDWVERPADKLYVSIAANKPRITPWGLLVQGGSFSGSSANTGEVYAYCLDSTFSRGTGGHGTSVANGSTTNFTSWTNEIAGTGTTTVWKDSNFRFDDTTYSRCAKLTTGNPHASNLTYLYQAISHGANVRLRARYLYSLGSSTMDPKQTSFILQRTIAAVNNDWSTAGWNATLAWRKFLDDETSTGGYGKTSLYKHGNFYEYWTDEIPFGASSGTLTNFALYQQENGATLYLHQAHLYYSSGSSGQAQRVIRREVDVVTSASVTNAADIVDLNNDESYRIALVDRGTVSFVFIPRWDHADLEDGAKKYLLVINHDSTNGDREEVFYERTNSTTAQLAFRRMYGGTTSAQASIALSGASLASFMVPMKVAIRWAGAAGELGLAAKTLDLFVDGVKGSSATAANYCRQKTTGAYVAIGREATGAPASAVSPATFADGYFSDMEFRADVLSDVQVAAIHNRTGQNLDLPTAVA